jgi:hypothetical protein
MVQMQPTTLPVPERRSTLTRTKFFGLLSFAITTVSLIPYFWGVWSGHFHPNVTSWILWSFIGFVMLLAYREAGATDNVWAGVVAFTNPFIITVTAIYKGNPWNTLGTTEWVATVLCVLTLSLWWYGHRKESMRWAAIAVFASILADISAGGLTIKLAWMSPLQEQPIAWGVYLIGEILLFFSITKRTTEQYALPVYGVLLALSILIPTVVFRIMAGIPFLQWF